MPSIEDLSIVDSNTATAKKVEHGLERTLCSPELCDSKNLTVYKRTVSKGKQLDLKAGKDYHLVYVMSTAPKGTISFKGQSNAAEEGAGVLLTPGDSAQFDAAGADLDLLTWWCPSRPRPSRTVCPADPAISSTARRCAV